MFSATTYAADSSSLYYHSPPSTAALASAQNEKQLQLNPHPLDIYHHETPPAAIIPSQQHSQHRNSHSPSSNHEAVWPITPLSASSGSSSSSGPTLTPLSTPSIPSHSTPMGTPSATTPLTPHHHHSYFNNTTSNQSMPTAIPDPSSMMMLPPSLPAGTAPSSMYASIYPSHHHQQQLQQQLQQQQKPRISTSLWDDKGTLCFQVDVKGICVARRQDNDMINGTKLLNVTGMSRGKRDGILKNEKGRVVVKVGAMHLKGVWVTFARAKALAIQYNIYDLLYPLFVDEPALYFNTAATAAAAAAAAAAAFFFNHPPHCGTPPPPLPQPHHQHHQHPHPFSSLPLPPPPSFSAASSSTTQNHSLYHSSPSSLPTHPLHQHESYNHRQQQQSHPSQQHFSSFEESSQHYHSPINHSNDNQELPVAPSIPSMIPDSSYSRSSYTSYHSQEEPRASSTSPSIPVNHAKMEQPNSNSPPLSITSSSIPPQIQLPPYDPFHIHDSTPIHFN